MVCTLQQFLTLKTTEISLKISYSLRRILMNQDMQNRQIYQ